MSKNNNTIFITGSSGFVGFHLTQLFLKKDLNVVGIDSINNYYDVKLKIDRNKILKKYKNFNFYKGTIENFNLLTKIFETHKPSIIIHLAAQAGVRYSIINPRSYLENNIVGTFNILEISKKFNINHLLIASSSSVYGSNNTQPFNENQKTDNQLSFYASSKKTVEIMSHSYSYNYNIPITIFRFFTVYGPWGRPDMALFKFTKSILNGEEIKIFNFGKMTRDFTYIKDLVLAIFFLKDVKPDLPNKRNSLIKNDSISSDAPMRIINIGNSRPLNLMDYINTLEKILKIESKKQFVDIQNGEVVSTWADVKLLKNLIGFIPKTSIEKGIKEFVNWYYDYYKC